MANMESFENNIIAISDLHIGAPSSLFKLLSVKKKFIETLKGYGRINQLILLGDILDLTMATKADAWNDAILFFGDVFSEVVPTDEIYYIPGNHDHHVWMMLVEQRGIVSPLMRNFKNDDGIWENLRALKPLKLIDRFTIKDETFVHAMFPPTVRDKLIIQYPFVRLIPSEEKLLLAHHGHYFDPMIMPLAKNIASKYKELSIVEECNCSYIESLFYYASIGRISREFLKGKYTYYKMLRSLFESFLKLTNITANDSIDESTVEKIIYNICEDTSYNLVCGHTHKNEQINNVYYTGGWLVEVHDNESPSVSPAIFQAKGSELKLDSFDVEQSEIDEAFKNAKKASFTR